MNATIMKACALLVLSPLAALGAELPQDPAVEKEIKKFQGEWRFTFFEVDGAQKPAEEYE